MLMIEKKTLELLYQGKPIASVLFASFGDPQGSCGSFTKGTCDVEEDVLPILRKIINTFTVISNNMLLTKVH
ncbi:hypothetical protein Q3G72_010443 [Acer saccharum]|nr:hypothetical protein Q3G72_010443 [Acer saccharum]